MTHNEHTNMSNSISNSNQDHTVPGHAPLATQQSYGQGDSLPHEEHKSKYEKEENASSSHIVDNTSSHYGQAHHEDSVETEVQLPPEVMQLFNQAESAEAKLELVLNFMQEALAKGGAHHFREFWEARKYALAVFKETLHASSRVQLWAKYSDLCREARRMKEAFDEQSAFIAEQIELAIQAVEDELKALPEKLASHDILEDLTPSLSIAHNLHKYSQIQHELNYLNAAATRLGSLKKELIKAEIRLKVKNKLFQHLARVGDILFPRRKELIATVSELFRSDVEAFIQNTFVRDLRTPELFEVREEVKALQHIAKALTLNTEVFSATREELSQCWDTIRDIVKERKKAQSEHKHLLRQHRDDLMSEISKIKASFERKEMPPLQASKLLKGISVKMRAMTLTHHDVQMVKNEIKAVDALISAAFESERRERREKIAHIEQERAKRVDEARALIDKAIRVFEKQSEESLHEDHEKELHDRLEEMQKQMSALKMTRSEEAALNQLLSEGRKILSDKRQERLMGLLASAKQETTPESKREIQGILERELRELEKQRSEVKSEIDLLRKNQGVSGNDIMQAMLLSERMEEAKARLEQLDVSIHELRSKQ